MAIRFIPQTGRLLVRPIGQAQTTESGLVLPESMKKEAAQEGVVLEVGDGVARLGAGHRVVYGQYGGQKIRLGNEELVIIKEEELYGHFVDVVVD